MRLMIFKEIRETVIKETGKDPYEAYKQQIHNAKYRGLKMKMTFPQWWDVWKDDFCNRGPKRGQLVMCRNGDVGDYELGNIRIDTSSNNAHEKLRIQQSRDIKAAWEGESQNANWFEDRFKSIRGGSFDYGEGIDNEEE